jgi:hypothetical protein
VSIAFREKYRDGRAGQRPCVGTLAGLWRWTRVFPMLFDFFIGKNVARKPPTNYGRPQTWDSRRSTLTLDPIGKPATLAGHNLKNMKAPAHPSLPAIDANRLFARIGEIQSSLTDPQKFEIFPFWLRNVFMTLREQFVPEEFSALFIRDFSPYAAGFMTGILPSFRELHAASDMGMRMAMSEFTQSKAGNGQERKLGMDIITGDIVCNRNFQKTVLHSLLGGTAAERRGFAEGLVLGCTVFEKIEAQIAKKQTDATPIYFVMWLYWPEISTMRSVGEAGRALGDLFQWNRNFLGDDWTSRFRKIANRVKLSYRLRTCVLHTR